MSIQEQAAIELKAINFGEEDSKVMLEILALFFKQWDSGGAVFVVAPILQRLIAGKPLSPITGADSEWIDRSEMNDGKPMWQNMRCSSVFKDADGAYDIDVLGHTKFPVTFPYTPRDAEVSDPLVEF